MGQTESPSPVVKGKTFSPVVEESWKKRELWKNARKSVRNAILNVAIIIILYSDMSFHWTSYFLNWTNSSAWYTEFTIIVICVLSIMMDVGRCASTYLFSSPVEVNLEQKRLLAVKETDRGFSTTPMRPKSPKQDGTGLVFTNSPTSGQSTPYSPSASPYSPTSSPWGSSSATPTHQGSFNRSATYPSPATSFSHNTSGLFYDRSLSGTPNTSYRHNLSTSIPYSPGDSFSMDSSGFRSKLSASMSFASTPSPSVSRMTDMKSLHSYLEDYKEKEYFSHLNSSDMSAGNSPSFWSYGRPSQDFSHMLRKNQYQLASRSPQSFKSRTDDSDNMGDEVWGPLGVTDDDLYLWIERLRKWIGHTIMQRLSREIDNVNAGLRKIGCEDTEIGEVSVSTLKQLALTKGLHVPTLNNLVPYLDLTSNQEYLVRRIRDLGKDSCISEFSWNRGGGYGKAWGEHLPTDASLVMHMFCTYLDSRLPTEIKYPDGRTFTSQYMMKTPDKPNLEKPDTLLIYQSSINPPHFQVVCQKNIFNLPKGRNNFFHAVLFFLYQLKTQHNGMIGRVNLGMSGINILQVLTDRPT